MTRALFITVVAALSFISSVALGGTVRGYVVDAQGRPAPKARVTACYLPPTDQRPPERPKTYAQTTADSGGRFTLTFSRSAYHPLLIASFDNQSGAAAASFDHLVRVALRRNRSRVVP